jgi:hypothetical protein
VLAVVVMLALAPYSVAQDAEATAQKSALAWLHIVDRGDYGESWDEAAKLFRDAITRADWEKAAAAARDPLGPMVSRKLKSTTYTETLPGAPDGEYVVLQYDTVFANKKAAVETVVPMKDPDGSWRVSGYFIK